MLRATVEIVPFGVEDASHTLGTVEIINDGTGDPRTGNYDVRVDGQPVSWARIEGHERDMGWVVLLQRVMEKLNVR